jgi:hypothetical protein
MAKLYDDIARLQSARAGLKQIPKGKINAIAMVTSLRMNRFPLPPAIQPQPEREGNGSPDISPLRLWRAIVGMPRSGAIAGSKWTQGLLFSGERLEMMAGLEGAAYARLSRSPDRYS